MRRSSGPRETARLSHSVRQLLDRYTAAGAAGITMLAVATPAEARIIYTPAHVRITATHPFLLDLNHDRTNDFRLTTYAFSPDAASSGVVYSATAFPSGMNQVWAAPGFRFTPALKAGIGIGPKRPFTSAYRRLAVVAINHTEGTTYFSGPWANGGKGVKNRYLGLKFEIKGKTHFGWARLSMNVTHAIVLTLSGYAYETIPNKPIIAGKTKGVDEDVHQPSTLGRLALGRK